jgi:RNA polymerase sigma factor for flagellar operon FliA
MASPEILRANNSLNLEKRDELVLGQMTEVHFIARRIHQRLPVFVPLEDLVHSGVLGLLDATEKYDSNRKVQFKTFAQFRIRGAILDSLRQLDRASRRLRAKAQRLNIASEQLSMRLGRQPTEDEMAHEVGLDLTALRNLAAILRSLESVDQRVGPGEDRTESRDLIEFAAADAEENPLVQYLRAEVKQQLAQAVNILSAREKRILSMYYFKQLTMQQIAVIFDVKKSKISQLHFIALAKLRAYFDAKEISVDSKTGNASAVVSN